MTRPIRYDAGAEIGFTGAGGGLARLRQAAPLRILRPRPEPDDRPLAVVANIAGGVAGGDRLSLRATAADAADVTVTGQAAEKVYRSDGRDASISLEVAVGAGSTVEYLPQGTILFDGARLSRTTRLGVQGDGRLLYGEILHLGRTAMQESFRSGWLHDRLELRHDGRPVWADALRLAGGASGAAAPSCLGAATTTALIVVAGPGAAVHLDGVRDLLGDGARDPGSGGATGAAAVFENGPLLIRWLSPDGAALRRDFGTMWTHLRAEVLGRPSRLPRIWAI